MEMIDNRVALPENYIIKNNDTEYQIDGEVGRGANCIVYNSSYTDTCGIKHIARIKELYPIYLLIERIADYQIKCDESQNEKFADAKKRFDVAYETNVKFRNAYGVMNSTVNASDRFSANGTEYVVMNLDEGEDYRSYKDKSLVEILMHVKSLATVIEKYHKEGYLHLDIKPENIFVIPETTEHIYLFDFDSVCEINTLKSKKIIDLSFSEGFSAPEQVQGNITKIGEKTDIYAIGALLFYKLFNRKPTFEEGRYSARFNYKEMPYYDERFRPGFYKKLDMVFRKTLATSPALRWESIGQLISAIDELIDFADLESAYLTDTFTYNSANFVGRSEEIGKIHDKIQDNNVLFLSGIGGIGKTELAKKYISEYRSEYDTVAFAYFQGNIEHTVCQEILINNMSIDKNEKESDYFERVLEVLRKTTTERDLILLDNFDVERDDRLEELLLCPCKFLITTRNRNVRDWNYNEVKIDRMNDEDDLWALFKVYNEEFYEENEVEAIGQLMKFVDGHTMTLELISKYLRDSGQQPTLLYHRFLEKSGVTNTDDNLVINHRKDRRMNSESVNEHISILFDVFDFDDESKEIMSSLSLFAGIRIKRELFENWCKFEEVSFYIEKLIKQGWIELNETTEKISLHQIIQDLIYTKLVPTTENCPHIVSGMQEYINEKTNNYSERRTKRRVFGTFAERISGDDLSYAKICLEYGKNQKIEEAILICKSNSSQEAFSILTELYMEKVRILCQCNDMFDCEESLEEYVQQQIEKIDDQFLLATDACKNAFLCDEKKQIIELVKLAKRMDSQMSALMMNGCFDDVEGVDRVYQKIIEILDLLTESVIVLDIPYEEKEKVLETARDFYSDGDYCAMYRWEHYSDFEKVDYYQELLDELRQEKEALDDTIYIHTGDRSHCDIGDEYMNEGDYNAAIKMYKKAYDENEEPLDWILPRLSEAYYKICDVDTAVDYLVEVLDSEKRCIECADEWAHYSGYICLDLIKMLVDNGRVDEAKAYARELIGYIEPEIQRKEDNVHHIKDVLVAKWYLYQFEENQEIKNQYWNNCKELFNQISAVDLQEEHLGFIKQYVGQEKLNYAEIIGIVFDFDPGYGNEEKRIELVDGIINNHQNDDLFIPYHILLLLKCAEITSNYSYKGTKRPLDYCTKAEALLSKIDDKSEYYKNKIIKVMAEVMSNDNSFDFDEVNAVRKQCDYYNVAEQEAIDLNDEKKIELWKDSADKYGYIDDYKNQIRCLDQAYAVMIPILNKYEYSRFDYKLWYIMYDLVMAWINISDSIKVTTIIKEMYERTLEFYKNKDDEKRDFLYKIKEIAALYERAGKVEKAFRGYLIWIYVDLSRKCDESVLMDYFDDIQNMKAVVKELIMIIVDSQIDEFDNLLDFKEAIENINVGEPECQIIQPLLNIIITNYQNKDVEFK